MPASRRDVLAAVAASTALTGCVGGDSTPSPADDEAADPADSPTATPTDQSGGAQSAYPDYEWGQLEAADPVETTTIAMRGFAFDPLVAAVPPGAEVTVTNDDSAGHTMTVPALGIDERLGGGERTTVVVEEPGTYDYVCEFHAPEMLGRLVVDRSVASTVTPTETPTTVQVREHPDLGEILVGPEGLTLYAFDSDDPGAGESTCHDDCADAWPPLTVAGDPRSGPGVAADLTTFERDGGKRQVAAAGWPLYYFAQDETPGDATGQGVGDVWWVLRPDGTVLRDEATATPTPTETDSESGTGGGY